MLGIFLCVSVCVFEDWRVFLKGEKNVRESIGQPREEQNEVAR